MVRAVNTSVRTCILAAALVATGVFVMAWPLWPVLGPLTQRTPLSPAARWSDAGVPVPASAHRCAADAATDAGSDGDSVRWCMPSGVSVATLAQWYDETLPPGRDAGRLRWCVEQREADGSRRALWSSGAGLVGYVLPPQQPRPRTAGTDDVAGVETVVLPGTACHPVARSSREPG